jgi:predicted PurR-regulated permease PerM
MATLPFMVWLLLQGQTWEAGFTLAFIYVISLIARHTIQKSDEYRTRWIEGEG